MSIQGNIRQSDVYRRLKKGFYRLSDSLDTHLKDTLLCDMGIDHIQVDLEDETERGGPYFLPMSQERINALNRRPEVDITIDEDWSTSMWNITDSHIVHFGFRSQLYESSDESAWQAWRNSYWHPCMYVAAHQKLPCFSLTLASHREQCKYEMRLWETYAHFDPPNPRSVSNWHIAERFEAKGFPHRSCISIAGIADVKGLTRAEVMIVTAMMISAMREEGAKDVFVVPV
jgi:hypothetical protein